MDFIVLQVLLVTGGYNNIDGFLDSTEVLEDITGTWRLTAPLPSARFGLRAASVDNNIFIFGENILYYINIEYFIEDIFTGGRVKRQGLKDILRYNKNHTWEEVGQMKKARRHHAVVVLEDVSQLCP